MLQEEEYESCTLLLGANDVSTPLYHTLEQLLALKRKAEQYTPMVFVAAYPDIEQPQVWQRVFGDRFIPLPVFSEDPMGPDTTHVHNTAAQVWAQNLIRAH